MSSALGGALGMDDTYTWAQVVSALIGVATKTSGSQSVTTSGKWGFSLDNGAWLYIPSNGYYKTAHWLNIPWNTIKSSLGTANTGQVLSGYSFTSQNGIKLSGTMKSYTSGRQSVTASGKWGFDTTYGAWLYIPTNGYYTTEHWLNIPYNTFKSNVNFSPKIKYKAIGAENKGSYIKTPSITITQTGTYILCMGGKIMYSADGSVGNQYGRLWVGSSEPSYYIQKGAATISSGGGCFSSTNPITISANTVVYAWMDGDKNYVNVSGEFNEMYLLVIGV